MFVAIVAMFIALPTTATDVDIGIQEEVMTIQESAKSTFNIEEAAISPATIAVDVDTGPVIATAVLREAPATFKNDCQIAGAVFATSCCNSYIEDGPARVARATRTMTAPEVASTRCTIAATASAKTGGSSLLTKNTGIARIVYRA